MQMISEGVSRREMLKEYGTLTPERVLGGGFASLARLRKSHTAEKVEMALAILLIDASRAFDAPLDKDTAYEIAIEVHTRYYYLTLEDCYIVLRRMKSKAMYGKISLNKYLVEFENYATERMKLADEMSYNSHLATSDAGTNRGGETVSVRELLKKGKR